MDDYLVSSVYWNNPKQIKPVETMAVLVVYDRSVWSGVFANDKVVRYPEDFGAVQLIDCDYWAAMPEVPLLEDE